MSPTGRRPVSRRGFLGTGLAAAAWGLLARKGPLAALPPSCSPGGGLPLAQTTPLLNLAEPLQSTIVDGLPFMDWFTGDDFTNETTYPFHVSPPCCMHTDPPEPGQSIDVAVIGGGLSGLATAYLLRQHRPVVFELHNRFGGNAAGEIWQGKPYPIGSAYVITPDPGTFLHQIYHQLGLHAVHRFAAPGDPIELGGVIRDDFWSGEGLPPDQQLAFQRYAEVVTYMAQESYPDIPLPEGQDNQWILDLDGRTLRDDIEERMGMPMPPLLAAAVQGYCYSSFGAGMQEISAAAGWNFLVAEEFGRWVFPGGNAYIAWALWRKLSVLEHTVPQSCRPYHLRGKCLVADVRLRPSGVQITYVDAQGQVRSLMARVAVMATPKHVAKWMIHDLENLDPQKRSAVDAIVTVGYVVANVLLEAPIERDFYDVFLLHDEQFPMTPEQVAQNSEVVDLLDGNYASPNPPGRNVLTLYWPLPWHSGRVTLIQGDPWTSYATRLAPQVRFMLDLLDVPVSAVRQIRMTRWGHAMPVATPGFIANGTAELVRRPIENRIFFVNQDNWALPAVENSLLDAQSVARQIESLL